MKKPIISFILLALFITNNATAQKSSIGLKLGGNVNIQTEIPSEFSGTPLVRPSFGLYYRYSISDKIQIQPEVNLSFQGVNSHLEIKDKLTPLGALLNVDVPVRDKLTYLNIPIIARFMLSKSFAFELGPQIGVSLGGRRVGTSLTTAQVPFFGFLKNEDLDLDYKLTTDTHLNLLEASIVGGFAYEGESGLGFNIRAQYGLTGVYKKDPKLIDPTNGLNIDITDVKNALVNVGLTYSFK